jgi:hypothetical protein
MRSTSLLANIDYLLIGMFEEQNSRSKDYDKKQVAFATLMYKDIRSIVDTYIPNIHILNTKTLAGILLKGMYENPEVIFSGLYDEERIAAARNIIYKNRAKIREAIYDDISALYKNIYVPNVLESMNADLNALLTAIGEELTPENVRMLGSQYQQVIAKYFGSNALISTSSPDIETDENSFIFFSKSFESNGKRRLNETTTRAILRVLSTDKIKEEFELTDRSSIVGEFSNFGHTAIKSDNSVAINSPALFKVIYNTSNAAIDSIKVAFRDTAAAERIFIKKTGHIKTAINVTKNFSVTHGSLLTFGISFTSDMDQRYNQQTLGKKEAVQSDRASPDRLNSNEYLRASLLQRVLSVGGGDLKKFADTLIRQKGSPSLVDFIKDGIINTTLGKQTSDFNQTTKRTVDKAVSKKVLAVKNAKVTPNKRTNKSSPDIPLPKLRDIRGRFTSLASLQVILNNNLAAQIEKNMGTGTSKNVLNYRTGRLANSARVEKLAQSREGTITAFYTYMKNPYATFSEGGAQQNPRSRDPKLLISKSIREIAATVVDSRMRAVLA